MKRTTIKSFGKNNNWVEAVNQNNTLIFVFFCFLLGILIGTLVVKFKLDGLSQGLSTNFNEYLHLRTNHAFLNILLNSVLSVLPFIAIVFLSGTCMVGSVLVPAISCYRGYTIGILSGFIYANYRLLGIVFNLLMIIPPVLLSSLGLILACREAFGFSVSLARLAMPNKQSICLYDDFKLYCSRQIFILTIFAASALLDAVLSVSFMSFFQF